MTCLDCGKTLKGSTSQRCRACNRQRVIMPLARKRGSAKLKGAIKAKALLERLGL